MTKNILVTGGAGYIGSHACKALQQAGYVPVTFDNLATGWQDAVKFGPFEQGDLLNRSDIDRVFEKYTPVAVMHFAALSQVGESMQKPGLYWQNNVIGSLNLIQAAADHGCMDVWMSCFHPPALPMATKIMLFWMNTASSIPSTPMARPSGPLKISWPILVRPMD